MLREIHLALDCEHDYVSDCFDNFDKFVLRSASEPN